MKLEEYREKQAQLAEDYKKKQAELRKEFANSNNRSEF